MGKSTHTQWTTGWLIVDSDRIDGFYAGPFDTRKDAILYMKEKTFNNPKYQIVRGSKTITTSYNWR